MATPEKHQSSPQSPTAIPPRTSSNTGMNGLNQAILKPGLQSLPEEDWISSGKKPAHSRNTSLTTTTAAPTTSGHHRRRSSSGMPHPPSQGSSWSPEKEKILMGPFEYLFEHPGKDIRSQLITAFNAWLKVPERSLEVITKVVGMLHTSSLLIDDVEDSSLLRRGIPVAHSIFGVAQTINSANYTYILALRSLSTLSNPLAISIYTDEMLNLHRGQGMELYWRDTLTCPTESDYLEMVGNKTGGLFRLAVKLMMAERTPETAPRDLVPLVNTIGQLFQIRDDYLNLRSPAYAANKGLCEDLTEGKFSFPIIHAVRADPANLQLLNILRQRSTDEDVKRYAVAYMERVGSFAYTRDVLEALGERAAEMVKALDREGEGEQLMGFLGKMAI